MLINIFEEINIGRHNN